MRVFFTLIFGLLLTACGANVQHKETGLAHEQQIIVIAKQLVGNTISVGKIVNHTITQSDLTPYQTGVAGAADAADENNQILSIKVDKGTHEILIKDLQGTTIYAKSLYLADGQIRTIRL
jgi:hypothetical protein